MRIATNQYQAVMLQSLGLNQVQMTQLTQKMATGKRVDLPSDDPVDSVRLSRLNREEAAIAQYRDNIGAIKLRMTKDEGFLSNMVNDMIPGRDLLVWALDGSNTPGDLQAMVTPLVQLRDSLFRDGNLKDKEGNWVFSGTATKTQPFVYDTNPATAIGKRYSFQGNENNQDVVVAKGITEPANQNLKGLEDLLNALDVAISEMSATDAAGNPSCNPNDTTVRADGTSVRGNLQATLDAFDDAIGLVSGKVATMGGIQNILKTMDDNHANLSLANRGAINDIGQLDMAEAATELNGYQNALQATYKAYSKIGNLTLFSEL
jgi:flagellar hook-associated protein 3 FlgL